MKALLIGFAVGVAVSLIYYKYWKKKQYGKRDNRKVVYKLFQTQIINSVYYGRTKKV